MTDAAVTADIHQTLDVELDGRTAFALDFDTQVSDRRTDRTDLVVRPILDFEVVADASDLENLAGRRTTDTVDIGQADLAPFIFCLIYTDYTCHIKSFSFLLNRLNITLGAF